MKLDSGGVFIFQFQPIKKRKRHSRWHGVPWSWVLASTIYSKRILTRHAGSAAMLPVSRQSERNRSEDGMSRIIIDPAAAWFVVIVIAVLQSRGHIFPETMGEANAHRVLLVLNT